MKPSPLFRQSFGVKLRPSRGAARKRPVLAQKLPVLPLSAPCSLNPKAPVIRPETAVGGGLQATSALLRRRVGAPSAQPLSIPHLAFPASRGTAPAARNAQRTPKSLFAGGRVKRGRASRLGQSRRRDFFLQSGDVCSIYVHTAAVGTQAPSCGAGRGEGAHEFLGAGASCNPLKRLDWRKEREGNGRGFGGFRSSKLRAGARLGGLLKTCWPSRRAFASRAPVRPTGSNVVLFTPTR